MKKIFKIPLILLSIITGFLMSGCEKGPQYEKFTYPPQTATGLSANSGFPGSYITITGKNFDTLPPAIKVWFGGILADSVISSNGTQIVVKVPAKAVSGKVSLKVWTTLEDSIGVFTVIPAPILTSVVSKGNISPIIAEPGDTVVLSGQNFLTDRSKVSVSFNGTPATNIVSLSSTAITVIAPSGYTLGNISATFLGNLTITGTALSPTLPQGDISSLYLKNYKQPFTYNNMATAQLGTKITWATPDYWTVSAAAQNQLNAGATARCGGFQISSADLALQAGWGDAIGNTLVNGKMYQTVSLPAGNYSFIVNSNVFSFKSGSANYVVAALGDSLPDIDNVPTVSLSYTPIGSTTTASGVATPSVITLNFTLTSYSTVTLGFVATQIANSYLTMSSVQLNLLN